MKPTYYHPELDCLRFFAFASVFIFHATEIFYCNFGSFQKVADSIIRSAGFGVDLFFCLSAFLITTILLKEKEASGQIKVRAFWLRRILRIWPLYYTFLILSLSLIPFITPVDRIPGNHVLPLFLFYENWAVVVSGFTKSSTFPLWSVSIEEQFYLLWPLAIKYCKNLYVVAIALIIIANLYKIVFTPSPIQVLWASTLTYLDTIGAGILLANFYHKNTIQLSHLLRILVLVIALLALPAYFFVAGISGFSEGKDALPYAIAALASPLMLVAIYREPTSKLNYPMVKIFAYLGKISYGLYVFHIVAIYLVASRFQKLPAWIQTIPGGIAASAILTLLLAVVSYHLLETPFLKLKRKQSMIETR